ncbi:nitrite reductase large subunit NirB [Gilvimarinus sp. F26214L]|uniref:nitrite reductase large subunit NirB n=1 Tax=Gilvimarinus sp. DZF01 TaxID=3461371 RepID=UPI0040463D8D
MSASKQRVLVVGNGMVGHKFIESLAAGDQADRFQVVAMGEEPRLAYDRVHLSSYFSGATAADLSLTSREWYAEHGVETLLGAAVTDIDRDERVVTLSDGRLEPYDYLVLATGSTPFVPPIPGKDREHCLVYRTIDDLALIKASASNARVGVVVGGGLLGLEAANALHNLGLQTHVVEFAPQLMGVQLDEGGGRLLRRKVEDLQLQVHTNKNTQEIVAGEECRYRMCFADGSHLETDLIVFSAGIRPRDDLARGADLPVGPRGGIIVNNRCRTADSRIYAVGECALWSGKIFGLVAPGYQMAKVAADHIAGGDASFQGADMSTKLKLMGVDVGSIGDAHGRTPGSESYIYSDDLAQVYKRLVVTADCKYLLGAVLVGDTSNYGDLLQLMLNRIELPENPATLILPAVEGQAAPAMGVNTLPETAQICSCNDVSKGAICAAVQNGCHTLGDLKAATKAATTCGGCSALVQQLLDSELTQLGVEVSNHICEHFPYSRRELADIVRVKGIRSFPELIDTHGTGQGCEICKPAVGSILASCWNEYILKDEHAPLQDTNDIFLANMQKDGTYSVVPRIPGGEITPEKLIRLGEVAKEFNLYTKITGGQRIDLFGAQLHELPAIWRKLVDVGFETGHAYGKALRTVKSCVGSTWCRYGVQDSVGTAIAIEERYRGLRAPHKIKMAVSGCTRECAEAQSKDVGVIATEKGWNLYVCGNGGMRPRHANLFATDVDTETLIQYIDRFLMFYIRTADRLQRTSVWLENLEGGLDYVKQVVIEDKLGIAAELEADMTRVIDAYQCEWKTTLENPEKLKRFRHFINSGASDSSLLYVQERGQRRPASKEERVKIVEAAV